MRGTIFFIILTVLSFTVSVTILAEETHFDPFARNFIFVEGESEITVAVNGFRLTFGFDIDKASFSEASHESARIINAINAEVKNLGLSNVEIIKGWDILRQAKISIGAKGRKISNKVTIQVINYPQGKLHELIAKIIDTSLAVDPAVALENIDVFISEEVENKKKEEVVTGALKALQSNAVRAAEAVGKKLSAPKRIFITNQEIYDLSEAYEKDRYYKEERKMALSSLVSIQKSFKVEAQIVDNMKLKAKVAGIYEVD